jgi:RNA polymerase sigma-70 factor, ECF subfamily
VASNSSIGGSGEGSDAPARKSEAEELQELMRKYQQSDTEAAAMLIERLSSPIFQFFLAQVRERSRAEDLLQDFWLRIHKARATYRPGEPLLPWAYAIARRVQIDQYRKTKRVVSHEIQSEVLPDIAAAQSSGSIGMPAMADMLKTLPEAQRETVLLLKVSGLSLEEVARATGTTVGAVKQRAHRAYEKLRKVLGREI